MATAYYTALFAVILVFQSSTPTATAAANFSFPLLPPLFGRVCQENVCGQGNCIASYNSSFGYECLCEEGWRQARSEDDDFLKFLPCVVPNCTLNYTCETTPSPVLDRNRQREANLSIFDPCFWTDCGGGYCNQTSPFTRTCECDEGFYNLYNTSLFPCYKPCSIGAGCPNLGLNYTDTSTSSSPYPTSTSSSPYPTVNLADQSQSNAATLIPRIEFTQSIIMVASLVLVVWYI